jgi:peptidoglycan/xylan/chitin deacetylase (PgdA/CDA1 family)
MGTAYKSTEWILQNLKQLTVNRNLNGYIILVHAGTDARRKNKLYNRLNELISFFKASGYVFKRADELTGN